MSAKHIKISVSLPIELLQWVEKYAKETGIEIPISRVVAKAVSDLRTKESKKK